MKTKTKIVIAAAITAYLAVGVTTAFAGSYKEPYGQATFEKACTILNREMANMPLHCNARSNGVQIALTRLDWTIERGYWEPERKKILRWLKDGVQPGTFVVTVSSRIDSISCDNKPSED